MRRRRSFKCLIQRLTSARPFWHGSILWRSRPRRSELRLEPEHFLRVCSPQLDHSCAGKHVQWPAQSPHCDAGLQLDYVHRTKCLRQLNVPSKSVGTETYRTYAGCPILTYCFSLIVNVQMTTLQVGVFNGLTALTALCVIYLDI